MIIYQLHPEHGKHLAHSVPEAERNNKAGWRTVTKEEFYGTQQASEVPAAPQGGDEPQTSQEAQEANEPAPKRRGRPPKAK